MFTHDKRQKFGGDKGAALVYGAVSGIAVLSDNTRSILCSGITTIVQLRTDMHTIKRNNVCAVYTMFTIQ